MDTRNIRCTVPCDPMTAESGCHCAEARDEILRLRSMLPRPIEEAPKDREVIGVERPPGEDRNFYRMVKWDDDKNAWVTQVDIDWSVSPGRVVYAVCHGVSHFIHPDAVPLIPEEIVEASDDD